MGGYPRSPPIPPGADNICRKISLTPITLERLKHMSYVKLRLVIGRTDVRYIRATAEIVTSLPYKVQGTSYFLTHVSRGPKKCRRLRQNNSFAK